MRQYLMGWLCLLPLLASAVTPIEPVRAILDAQHRQADRQRDHYRHPLETLRFFDVRPHMTVVEIWPGSKGWYTAILGPLLRDQGTLYAAHFNEDAPSAFYRNSREQFGDVMATSPTLYGQVIVTTFDPPHHTNIAPAGSADRVLTFRNVHNWYMRGGGDERVLAAFKAFYKALKPGGILGVVEHRLPATRPLSEQQHSGYMHEDYVIRLAQQAGFRLLQKSEINANAKDPANHPEGVWTLPPSLRLGEDRKEHYMSIGESDRMTLAFIKDAN